MRLVAVLLASLALAACGLLPGTSEADAPAALRPGPVPAHPDSLLARLVPAAFDDALGAPMRHTLDGTATDTLRVAPSPLPLVLPDVPPFADPRTRDAYTRRLVPTVWPRGAAAEAVLADARRGLAVRRAVVVVDTLTGRVLAAEVWRRSRSVLYNEEVHATVHRGTGGDAARGVVLDVQTDTPGAAPRRHVQTWTSAP